VNAPAHGFRIRASRPGDVADLYRVCLSTGDAGADAGALYDDPDLLGHLYVGPYAALEPEHALVLETAAPVRPVPGRPMPSGSAAGYAVAALDTLAFHALVRARWLPPLQRRYPDPGGDPAVWTPDQRLMHLLHQPDEAFPASLPEALHPFPSHLHIDLLPSAQGRGLGRALLDRLLAALRRDGSRGVHLGVVAANVRAVGFYQHLGFTPLIEDREARVLWMGHPLR